MTGNPKQPYGGAPLTEEEIAQCEFRAAREGWVHKDLDAFDQFLNVFFLHGLPDETMSSHFQRMANSGNKFGKMMIAWLDILQKRHGQKAQAGDAVRAHTVEDVEKKSLDS